MRVRAYGRAASIIDQLPTDTGAALREVVLQMCGARGMTCIDVIPTATSVVVTHREDDAERMRELLMLAAEAPPSSTTTTRRVVEIPVRYDGEDLESVAQACSLTTEQLIALHSGVEYEVSFCGFAPGFAYLVGLPHQLHLPRRASPRTRVPAGSVAIAAKYSAVYPRESPGGWHLLGTTNASMWDVSRQPPALLQPGMGVRFVRVE